MKRIILPITLAALLPSAIFAADYLDRSAWTWKTSSECSPEEDITGLKGIYDGNTVTCWHSNYHAENGTPERANPHWVMIDRGSDSSPVYGLSYIPRQNSGVNPSTACTKYAIYFADKSLENTPSTSAIDIEYAIGSADVSGNWAGDNTEKIVMFEKPTTARYILFVNLESYSSKSAACAEMNLMGKSGQGTGDDPIATDYNAIQIETPAGNKHRIAIDGENLAFSMVNGNIRMGNSGITIEYAMSEVRYFRPEKYDFADEEFYVGPKEDIYAHPVLPVTITLDSEVLTLEEGETAKLTATVENEPDNASVNWESSDALVATVNNDGMVTAVKAGNATITATCGEASASCVLTVTAKTVTPPDPIDPDDPDNPDNPDDPGSDSIDSAEMPTISFKRVGDNLIVSGITTGNEVTLHSVSGLKVCTADVSARGTAVLPVGSLPRTAYILSASGLTMKISF